MKKIGAITLLAILILNSFWLTGCGTTSSTPAPADFYKGKTINLVVSGDAGSIADLNSRVIATHLGADTEANVSVENRAEAGGLDGTNYTAMAEKDGLTLGTISMVKLLSAKILKDPAAQYELADFDYILSIGLNQTFFFVSASGPYQSLNDLKAGSGLKIAAGSASGYISLAGLSVIDLLGLDAKLITGFENNTARSLATQRGEVAGYATSLTGLTGGELDKGTLKPLFVLATQRDPIRPDVPAITEFTNLSADDLALVKMWETGLSYGTVTLAPAGIATEKYSYLNGLAHKWTQEADFCQEVNRAAGIEIKDYTSGESLKTAIFEMAAKMESFQSRFAEMIKKYRM
jgi:tripartite-type tricarboxylate transporter receptor subunit TctC